MRAFALFVGVFVFSVGCLQPAGVLADDPAIPPYDGAMSFPMIVGPASPEEFSWEVALNQGQGLEPVDDQHAQIYYIEGHQPALTISAQAAHDADGSTVPTTLSVSGASVVTLTVHHRAGNPIRGGAPFNYPILAGPGFEDGGFQPAIVTEPPSKGDPHGQMAAQPAKVRKGKGKIGGRPSTRLTPPDQGKQTTPALVIGRGHLLGGPVELDGRRRNTSKRRGAASSAYGSSSWRNCRPRPCAARWPKRPPAKRRSTSNPSGKAWGPTALARLN